MLDDSARIERYQLQTGGPLTDRQQRRINHKRRHQGARATAARIHKASEKKRLRTVRTATAYLPQTSR